MGPYFIESFNKPYRDISCSVHAYSLVVPPTSLTLPNLATSTHDMDLVKGVHDLQQRLPDFCLKTPFEPNGIYYGQWWMPKEIYM